MNDFTSFTVLLDEPTDRSALGGGLPHLDADLRELRRLASVGPEEA